MGEGEGACKDWDHVQPWGLAVAAAVVMKRETPIEIMVEVQWKGICGNKENGVR